eukprot:TRINITY_DN10761_c0_g1_i1.p1 TRINITY_DN10761_c0_g1~~TRINITY_DN10761_c0_g1_i1.p1  ORF type:complete len:490 (+),score=60.74 TRINITY_DN10761_c0_g1_i1:223-1692(+)
MVHPDQLSSRAQHKRLALANIAQQLKLLDIDVPDVSHFCFTYDNKLALCCGNDEYLNAVVSAALGFTEDEFEELLGYCNPFPNLAYLSVEVDSDSHHLLVLNTILACSKSNSPTFTLHFTWQMRDHIDASYNQHIFQHLIDQILDAFAQKKQLTFEITFESDYGYNKRPPWTLALASRLVELIVARNRPGDCLSMVYDEPLWYSVINYLRRPMEYKFKLHVSGLIAADWHYADKENQFRNLSFAIADTGSSWRPVHDVVKRKIPSESRFSIYHSKDVAHGTDTHVENQVPTEAEIMRQRSTSTDSIMVPYALGPLELPTLERLEFDGFIDCPLTARHAVLWRNGLPRKSFEYLDQVQVLDLTNASNLSRRVLTAVDSGDWSGSSNLRALLVIGPNIDAAYACKLCSAFPNLVDFAAINGQAEITGFEFHRWRGPFTVNKYGAMQVARQQIAAFTLAVELAGVNLTKDVLERVVLPVIASVERCATYADA